MSESDKSAEFLLSEYTALRSEILTRSEFQHQLISFALAAFGALATIGLKDSSRALLAYPVLALFLAVSWTYNDMQIAQIGMYIKHRIEDHLATLGQGWQHAILSQKASREIGALAKLATRGMFWGSEFLVLGLYMSLRVQAKTFSAPIADNLLLGISVVATVLTMWIMRNRDATVHQIELSMRKPPASPDANGS